MTVQAEVAAVAAANNPVPPSRLGLRYNASGFLPEAGNTVVCHLDRSNPAHKAVLAARAAIQALPGAENLLFTHEDSLHMTIFEGVIETRRSPDAWPDGMDVMAPVEEISLKLKDRLTGFTPPPAFQVSLTALRPGGLNLDGATQADRKAMRAWRDALTGPFGFRHSNHDTYRFHMTFAYILDWLPDDLVPAWEEALQTIQDDLIRAAPVIPLVPPAFCSFADMNAFPEILVLGN
ncbi:DUF1868 domain-containing protein [uncultured Roseobacter sp.]|uniref:DUF1868 domain-containing protein n=1 Tax=uncultured Roseobacter sp. TaxID=114847 RepID=UPI0026164091|nr:DUF1868 domain-containing protein [uncultured Roseobacter sp.]